MGFQSWKSERTWNFNWVTIVGMLQTRFLSGQACGPEQATHYIWGSQVWKDARWGWNLYFHIQKDILKAKM